MTYLAQAATIFEEIGNTAGQERAWQNLATVYQAQGDESAAALLLLQAAALREGQVA